MKKRPLTLACLSACLALSGCAEFDRKPLVMAPDATERARQLTSLNGNDGAQDMSVLSDVMPEDALTAKSMQRISEPLPHMRVTTPLSVSETGAFDAVRVLLRKSGLSLSVNGDVTAGRNYGGSSLYDVTGTLTEVMDQIADSAGFFYYRKGNTVFVEMEQQFIVALPPIVGDDSLAGLFNTIQYVGVKDPYLDRTNRTLVFTANRKTYNRVVDFLERTRQTRSVIVYDMQVYQVDLNDASSKGIQWNKLGYNSTNPGVAGGAVLGTGNILGGAASGTSSAVTSAITEVASAATMATRAAAGMGLVLAGSRFSTDILINFLEEQGTVKTLSRPRIGVINGSKARIRVGASNAYVSRVGTNFSTSVNQVTMETSTLRTGIEVSLVGAISDGSVYTTINMSISELIKFDVVSTLGLETKLPQTADRELETIVRARPGDTVLLGGITIDKEAGDVSNGLGNVGKVKSSGRSELVIALTPRILRFAQKAAVEEKAVVPATPAQPLALTNKPAEAKLEAKPEVKLEAKPIIAPIQPMTLADKPAEAKPEAKPVIAPAQLTVIDKPVEAKRALPPAVPVAESELTPKLVSAQFLAHNTASAPMPAAVVIQKDLPNQPVADLSMAEAAPAAEPPPKKRRRAKAEAKPVLTQAETAPSEAGLAMPQSAPRRATKETDPPKFQAVQYGKFSAQPFRTYRSVSPTAQED